MSSSAQRINRSRRKRNVPQFELKELFNDDEYSLKLSVTKHRILKAFDEATYWSHGKLRGTDCFIIGVGPKQKDLARHIFETVVEKQKCGIVTASELPGFVGDAPWVLRDVARDTEEQLIAVRLAMFAADELWFNHQVPGTWNIGSSLMSQYHRNRGLVRAAKKIDARLRREALHGGNRLEIVH